MTSAAGGPDDGGLFGSRREGPMPKLVVVGIVWAGFGVVALITALLMSSTGIAVFGVLCVLAGGGLYAGQRARERLESDERSWRSDPGGFDDDPSGAEFDDPDDGAGRDDDRDRQHDTRVMSSSSRDPDDIVDAEYSEYVDYDPSPSDQDDGTGYDEEETAYQRRREDQWARESRAREDDTQVIEADDEDDPDDGPTDERTSDGDRSDHGGRRDDGRDDERDDGSAEGSADDGPRRRPRDASR